MCGDWSNNRLKSEIQIIVFRNNKKNADQPDYDILLSEPKEAEE